MGFPGHRRQKSSAARHPTLLVVGTQVSHLVVERPGLAKLCFCVPACLCIDLSDDIPAVSVAFVTLEE